MIDTLKEVREALRLASRTSYSETNQDVFEAAITKLDALIAQEKAEPVGEVRERSDSYGGTFVHWKKLPVAGMTLYITPQPAPSTSPLTDIEVEALAICRRAGNVSVSRVQRILEISYDKAGEICQSIIDKGQCDELEFGPSLKAHKIGAKP